MKTINKIARGKAFTLLALTVVTVAGFSAANGNYLSLGNFSGIMTSMSLAGTFSVGLVCLLIAGHVDLASGAEGCMAGVVVALLLQSGVPWPLALTLTVSFGGLMGLINAFLVNVLGFMAFIATIGMSSVWKGLALVISDGASVSVPEAGNEGFYRLGMSIGIFPIPFIIMAVLFVVYGLMLKFTKFGRNLYLLGGNATAARLAGISPKKVSTILFVNCGAISALGGALFTARMHMGSPNAVWGTEMNSIASAVLGGVSFMGGSGDMGGAFIGLALINLFNNGLNAVGLEQYWQIAAQGSILLAALTLDWFGMKRRRNSAMIQGG
jgi:ribose transport system permease protein